MLLRAQKLVQNTLFRANEANDRLYLITPSTVFSEYQRVIQHIYLDFQFRTLLMTPNQFIMPKL